MENRIDILNELRGLSPLVAGVEKVNVFTVPVGYFERLEEDILMGVKVETGVLFNSITNQPSMQVPQGYFESLSDSILNKIKAEETGEVKGLSPMLVNIQNKNVFTVPQGYFESLSANILNKINEGETTASELKGLSPVLFSIQHKNVFTVPQGYFETLPDKILNKIKPQQAKVITMQKRTAAILKYAVAAVFIGAMALAVYKFTNSGDAGKTAEINYSGIMKTNVDGELATVSDDEILSFLTKEGVDVDAAVAAAQIEDKLDADETNTDKAESNEIDELLNQLDDNRTMN
jgi:major membrane immunogen (membrane-anchored lipoprotein)